VTDMLAYIMQMQRDFQDRVPNGVKDFKLTSTEKTMADVQTQGLACIVEIGEALAETGWKPWASSNHINVEPFRSELIDALRFLMNLIIISGMSPEGVVHHYEESIAKTNARVDNGYTGLEKCPGCHRAYDEKYTTKCYPKGHARTKSFTEDDPAWCNIAGWVSPAGDIMNYDPDSGWYIRSSA